MHYALVSGGSKGIGFAIAAALAKRKFNLILIARNKNDLEAAKIKLEKEYQIHVEILPFDLSQQESAYAIGKWCTEKNLQLKILCNVAGIGGSKDYLSTSLDDTRYMLRLNTEPAVALIFNLLPLLKKNSPSYILNVGSMAGFAPIPEKNIYSATKSAIIFFSYSLRYQLKKDNISVSCLCPGPVFTKLEIQKETIKKLGWLGKQMAVLPEQVGEIAVRKILRKKMLITPGILASIISILLRLLPRRLMSSIYYKLGSGRMKEWMKHVALATGVYPLAIGGVSGVIADPKIIFLTAIGRASTSIILAHNHPSGSLEPSKADIAMSRKLKDGGKILDIPVLDHLIITPESFLSLTEEGEM